MFDVKTATTKELVAEYNRLSGKAVTKFSSRAAGEKQVSKLLSELPPADASGSKEDTDRPLLELTAQDVQVSKPKKRNSQSAKQELLAAAASRSPGEAIARSWQNPQVAAERAKRDSVEVDGIRYRSVGHAFAEIELPMSKCIPFRMKLKALGKLAFTVGEGDDAKVYNFKITKKDD